MITDADILHIVGESFDAGVKSSILKDTIGRKPSLTKMEAEDYFTKETVKEWLQSGDIKVERSETNRLMISTESLIRAYVKKRLREATKVRVAERIKTN